jgi:hypothetical protein
MMQRSLKKMLPAIGLLINTFPIVAAEENANDAKVQRLERRITSLEQKSQKPTLNPWARPEIGGGFNLFATGDFLYWKANENGLAFADSVNGHKHTIEEPSFKWNPGFRIGLGHNMTHDDWDAYVSWTCFHDRATKNVDRPSNGELIPSWIHPVLVPSGVTTVNSAKSHLRLHINLIDIELGREFYVSKFLDMRPFFGLRSSWVQQRYRVDYKGFPTVPNFSEFETIMKNYYWGLGVRGGLNTRWFLGADCSLYANAAISAAYGHFRVTHNEQAENAAGEETAFFRSLDRFSGLRAITDLALGFRWDTMFDEDRFHLALYAGWEQHVFFSQNQLMQYVDLNEPALFFTNKGNLTLNGLTVGGRFDF